MNPLTPRQIEYTIEHGKIVLPKGAPFDGFDGQNVLIYLPAAGWVEAWFCEEQWEWVCANDKFTADFEEVTEWAPLPDWRLTRYHAGRGDAAQEYADQFGEGKRDWSEFRWEEVFDRMMAVAPPDCWMDGTYDREMSKLDARELIHASTEVLDDGDGN